MKFTPNLAKKWFMLCSEHIKLILADLILILLIFRENSVTYRYFREN